MQTDPQTIIEQIRAFAAERKLRPSRLARQAGLSVNTLRGFDKDDWNPKVVTLQKLADFVRQQRAA